MMSSKYYPLFLDLSNNKVLIIGGGRVAARKARSVLQCGGQMTLVSPQVCPEIRRLAGNGKMRVHRRNFILKDLKNKALVICATDNWNTNLRVSRECKRRGIFVNVVDQPALCDFIVPAVVRRGDVTFAVSTGGSSPALAKFIRKKVETNFGPEVNRLARLLKKYRGRILKLPKKMKKNVIKELVCEKTLNRIREGKTGSVEQQLKIFLKDKI